MALVLSLNGPTAELLLGGTLRGISLPRPVKFLEGGRARCELVRAERTGRLTGGAQYSRPSSQEFGRGKRDRTSGYTASSGLIPTVLR